MTTCLPGVLTHRTEWIPVASAAVTALPGVTGAKYPASTTVADSRAWTVWEVKGSLQSHALGDQEIALNVVAGHQDRFVVGCSGFMSSAQFGEEVRASRGEVLVADKLRVGEKWIHRGQGG